MIADFYDNTEAVCCAASAFYSLESAEELERKRDENVKNKPNCCCLRYIKSKHSYIRNTIVLDNIISLGLMPTHPSRGPPPETSNAHTCWLHSTHTHTQLPALVITSLHLYMERQHIKSKPTANIRSNSKVIVKHLYGMQLCWLQLRQHSASSLLSGPSCHGSILFVCINTVCKYESDHRLRDGRSVHAWLTDY